ncbi:uncharacterized protein PG998_004698 [Apiospora kogelbergensis]|uniref:uncharacterized protein n=1 Tax=Apiospora kogelbergensis TaxID=1337665 RepID=UPI00313067BC
MIHLELFAVVTIGTVVFRHQINKTIKRCWKALHQRQNATLLLHIFISILEVARYYVRRYYYEYYLPYSNTRNNKLMDVYNITTAGPLLTYNKQDVLNNTDATHNQGNHRVMLPTADLLDLVLMLIQCHTSLVLARDRSWAGHKSILRPVYHAQALMRFLLTAGSFFLSHSCSDSLPLSPSPFPQFLEILQVSATWHSPERLYRASVMINVSFIYPRLLVWTLKRLGSIGPMGRRYSDIYTFSIFLSAILSMHDGGVTLAPQLYLAVLGFFVVLERWVARKVLERAKIWTDANSRKQDTAGKEGVRTAKKEDTIWAKSNLLKTLDFGVEDRVVDFLYWYGFVEKDMLQSENE